MELSIVMPCLNEARTLPVCIEKAKRFLATSGVVGEIVVADNGSTDGSVDLATSLGARVVPVDQKGYGAALSAGILSARGKFVIMGDSDDSYNFLALQPFVDKLREGFDLVMGNRFLGGISRGAMPLSHRFFGNPMLSALGRRIYDHDVCGDFYCGLRGFRRDAILRLAIQSRGMEFALEMIIKAELYRLKITEVPTTLSPDGRDRKPHLRTYRDGWRSLRLYLLMSPRWTFGIPGILVCGLGALALLARFTVLGPCAIGIAAEIFGLVGVILGYQAVLLAIFSKLLAIEIGLHPPPTKFSMLRQPGTLEWFVAAGTALALLSLTASVLSLTGSWASGTPSGFAAAPVFPAVVLGLILGGQTMLAGFFLGFMRLLTERREFPRKRSADNAAP